MLCFFVFVVVVVPGDVFFVVCCSVCRVVSQIFYVGGLLSESIPLRISFLFFSSSSIAFLMK